METIAKIKEMGIKMKGAESEALADFADAMIEMDLDSQKMKQVLPQIMNKLSQLERIVALQASNPPEGILPQ
jgi:hypothetical protein